MGTCDVRCLDLASCVRSPPLSRLSLRNRRKERDMRKGITGLAAGFIAGTVLAGSAAFAIGVGTPALEDRSADRAAISRESTGSPAVVRAMNASASVDATRTDSGHMTIPQAQSAQHEAERIAAAARMAAEARTADHVAPAPRREVASDPAHEADAARGTVCAPTPKQAEVTHREQMSTGGHDTEANHDGMGHQ